MRVSSICILERRQLKFGLLFCALAFLVVTALDPAEQRGRSTTKHIAHQLSGKKLAEKAVS
jgi:hypothetical protein